MRSIISLLVLCSLSSSLFAQDNWPNFRGPNAGVSDRPGLPSRWKTSENVEWAVDVPGRGWSSPIVWNQRIYLTTVAKKGEYEDAKKGLYFGGERLKPSTDEHRWLVQCRDFQTGKLLWEHEAAKGIPATPIHIKNSYASETPVTDGERVYAYFGNQGLYCYDMNGKPLWSRPFAGVPMKFGWGTAASPVLHGDKLFIVNDNEQSSYLVCLDKRTGKEIWKIDRAEKSNWATPFVWQHEQRTELVVNGTNRVRSYDLDGQLLWEMRSASSITIPTPFSKHGLLYLGSGYVLDSNKPLVAVRPGAKGDITLAAEQDTSEFVAWRQRKAAPYNPSFLVYGDYLYVLYDQGFLSCYEAKTGKPVYERERLGGMYTVSPWAHDGKIFCLNEDGTTTVVQAGREFKVIGRNPLEEMCMATPAVYGDSLLIRTLTKLYRIREKTP